MFNNIFTNFELFSIYRYILKFIPLLPGINVYLCTYIEDKIFAFITTQIIIKNKIFLETIFLKVLKALIFLWLINSHYLVTTLRVRIKWTMDQFSL